MLSSIVQSIGASSGAVSYKSFDLDDTYVYALTSGNTLNIHDIKNSGMVRQVTGVVSQNSGICLISAASAIVTSSSTNRVDFINVQTGQLTQVTSGANTTYSGQTTPQVACNQSLGVSIATRSSNGNLMKITNSQVLTTISPTSLSGAQGVTIILKQATGADPGRWLIGTNNGKVIEIDSSGIVYKTLTLPTTPNIGTAPTVETVVGLAHYPPNLLVISDFGNMFMYEYESSTLLHRSPVPQGTTVNPSNGVILSNSASGYAIMGTNLTYSNTPLAEVVFNLPNLILNKPFWNSDVNAGSQIIQIKINPNIGVAVASFSTVTGYPLYLYKLNSTQLLKNIEQIELQKPEGFRIAGRVIAIRDYGVGQTAVEIDQQVSNIQNPLSFTDGGNYIVLAMTTDETYWDIREFTE